MATEAGRGGARRRLGRRGDRCASRAPRSTPTCSAASSRAPSASTRRSRPPPRRRARFDAPLRARVDAGATRTGELGARLRELGAGEVELRQAAEETAQRATEIEIELTRIDAQAADAQRRRDEAEVEPAEGDDRGELAARVERLERGGSSSAR